VVKLLALACAVAGCTTFEDPDIVIDIRVLGMSATVPEQVLDVDLANPPMPADLLAMMQPTVVCALVADPTNQRRLRWTMTLCPQNSSERCYDDHPQTMIGMGVVDDPETATPNRTLPANCVGSDNSIAPDCMCATVNPDGNLLAVLLDALNDDPLHGFQGLDYAVSLRVGGEDGDPDLDQYAEKALRVAARVPSTREPNNNPSLQQLQGEVGAGGPFIIPLGRCADTENPITIEAGTSINLFPAEAVGARETYVIPTLDGGSEMFTESLTYQWTANAGSLSRGDTGGPRDPFGNDAPLDTDWSPPKVTEPTDFLFWLVQRDERLGEAWYEFCLRVVPAP
jgi:hypothetical protein